MKRDIAVDRTSGEWLVELLKLVSHVGVFLHEWLILDLLLLEGLYDRTMNLGDLVLSGKLEPLELFMEGHLLG